MIFFKKTIVFIFFIALAACEKTPTETNITKAITEYIKFQKELGLQEQKEYSEMIQEIFANDIVKVEDHHIVATGHDEFKKHLMDLRNNYGSWYISVKKQSKSKDETVGTIRYEIVTDKVGTFEVVALLKLSDDNKIKEIDESYYRLEIDQQD